MQTQTMPVPLLASAAAAALPSEGPAASAAALPSEGPAAAARGLLPLLLLLLPQAGPTTLHYCKRFTRAIKGMQAIPVHLGRHPSGTWQHRLVLRAGEPQVCARASAVSRWT